MKIYVAAASTERHPRASRVMDRLALRGHEITHDWTHSVDMNESVNLTPPILRGCALSDYAGVMTADALVLLTPGVGHASLGAWVEFGIALARGIPVLVAGKTDCIFGHMPGVKHFETDDKLVMGVGSA